MINREGKLNLSTSGGSDLNQELVENSDYTKSTPESEMMSNDGIESSGMNGGENMMSGGGSSTPNKTSMMGENDDEDYDKEDKEGGNSVGNYSNDDSYKVSDMNSRMNPERDAKEEVNDEPSMRENTLTKSDVPYDVPDDQTPPMSDMPKNIENMTKKGDNSEPASE
jgi:hypothetical protein